MFFLTVTCFVNSPMCIRSIYSGQSEDGGEAADPDPDQLRVSRRTKTRTQSRILATGDLLEQVTIPTPAPRIIPPCLLQTVITEVTETFSSSCAETRRANTTELAPTYSFPPPGPGADMLPEKYTAKTFSPFQKLGG